MTAVLQIDQLCKSFAGVQALAGVSFAIEEGSITGPIRWVRSGR